MAKLYVTEYVCAPGTLRTADQIPQEPGADQTPVVIGAGSLQSAAFAAATTHVRIHTDVICSVAFGANPTATANNSRMAAGTERLVAVRGGDKVAVITNT
jgi:hypothetical protein